MSNSKPNRHHYVPSFNESADDDLNAIPDTGTVTRSVSFEAKLFKALERKRRRIGADRSTFLRHILEDALGIRQHPELRSFSQTPTTAARAGGATPPAAAATPPMAGVEAKVEAMLERLLERKLEEFIQKKLGG